MEKWRSQNDLCDRSTHRLSLERPSHDDVVIVAKLHDVETLTKYL